MTEAEYTMIAGRLQQTMRGTVRRREPMAPHTTWRVGGPAELFIVPADRESLVRALQVLDEAGCPWWVVGYGSNILVRDGGLAGAVIHTAALRRFEVAADGRIEAEGGVPLMLLVRAALRRGLAGIEGLAGIPATIGGAVAMNAGAHGQVIGDVVREVVTCGSTGCTHLAAATLEFAYRHCRLPAGAVVAGATLQLRPADAEALRCRVGEVLATRRAAHSVGGANAGSVFRNPAQGAAWKLIDAAGMRGRRIGGARVSWKHANFIVNDGRATAGDIEALLLEVAATVLERTGVTLEPEVRIWGDRPKAGNA